MTSVRNLTDKIVYTNFFLLINVFTSFFYQKYEMTTIMFITCFYSHLYHKYHETQYNNIEGFLPRYYLVWYN